MLYNTSNLHYFLTQSPIFKKKLFKFYQCHDTITDVSSWFIAQPNVTEYVSDCIDKLFYMPAVLYMLETCAKLWVFNLYATGFKWLQSTFAYDIIFAWHLNFCTWFPKNFIISGTKKDLIMD